MRSRKSQTNRPSVRCALERLERRALLSAAMGLESTGSLLDSDRASAQFYSGMDVINHGDNADAWGSLQREMPFRGGDRNSLLAPAAPGDLSALAAGSSRIQIGWADRSDNERGFYVYRSTDGSNFTLVATLRARSASYADDSVSAGTCYHYRVAAFNDSGMTFAASTATATTSEAPAELSPQAEARMRPANSWPK